MSASSSAESSCYGATNATTTTKHIPEFPGRIFDRTTTNDGFDGGYFLGRKATSFLGAGKNAGKALTDGVVVILAGVRGCGSKLCGIFHTSDAVGAELSGGVTSTLLEGRCGCECFVHSA